MLARNTQRAPSVFVTQRVFVDVDVEHFALILLSK